MEHHEGWPRAEHVVADVEAVGTDGGHPGDHATADAPCAAARVITVAPRIRTALRAHVLRLQAEPSGEWVRADSITQRNRPGWYPRETRTITPSSIDLMSDTPRTRVEKDSMGELEVPADALYGASTQRAVLNFPISGQRFPRRFLRALAEIKQAAAETNASSASSSRLLPKRSPRPPPKSPKAATTTTSRSTSTRPAPAPRPIRT